MWGGKSPSLFAPGISSEMRFEKSASLTTMKNDGRRTPTIAHLRTNLVAVRGNEPLAIRLSFVALDLFASSGLFYPRPLRES